MNALWLVFSLALPVSAAAWVESFPDAVKAASASKQPILVDFQAPWCYSCYYMEQKVLSKPGFEKAAKTLVALRLDVDLPEGRKLKERHAVVFLPTYLVLSPGGDKELGRIVGEQSEADFLSQLSALSSGKKAGDDAALEALRAKAGKGDVEALKKLLVKPADCKLPYAVMGAMRKVDSLYPEHNELVLKGERKALESLSETRLFIEPAKRCADFRSGVESLAEVYQKQKDAAARSALLERAVKQLQAEGGAAGQDRNRDDDLRYFLELKDDDAAARAWYDKLLAAYPADYVYAYRFAKRLHAKGQDAEALPFIEKSDKLSYGANRLQVTKLRAEILARLGRKAEALALLARDAKAAKGTFPKEAGELEKTAVALGE